MLGGDAERTLPAGSPIQQVGPEVQSNRQSAFKGKSHSRDRGGGCDRAQV